MLEVAVIVGIGVCLVALWLAMSRRPSIERVDPDVAAAEILAPPPPPPMHEQAPLPESGTIGKYRVLERLDEGGMAFVYRVADGHGTAYAMKIPNWDALTDPDFAPRFQREIAICRELKHPCIIHTIDSGTFPTSRGIDVPYMVMELVSGQPLDRWIEAKFDAAEPPDLPFAISVCRQVAEALEAFHEKSVIHRDLKPGNIMLWAPGRIKVMDFGIARSVRASTLTAKGFVLGTPAYMAPEQAVSSHLVDERADLYSLGVLLYLMATWRLPFEDADPFRLVARKKSEDPPPSTDFNPAISEGLAAVIARLLERDLTRRYRKAVEVAFALQELERGHGAPTQIERHPGVHPEA